MNILILKSIGFSLPSQGTAGIDAENLELSKEYFRLLQKIIGFQLCFHLFLHVMVLACSLILWQLGTAPIAAC